MITKWLEKTIIGLDICPFTSRPYHTGKILIEELAATKASEAQIHFLDTLNTFQGQKKVETILMVFPDWKVTFKKFYAFSEVCEDLLYELNLGEEYQLVAFHPKFSFEGLAFSDRANLVNSSPLPMIHLLRKIDLDLINLSIKDAENLSFGNAKKLELLSADELREHFPWR